MPTFSAGIPLPIVLGLNVIIQIGCGSCNMFTVITFKFQFFMFCLFMVFERENYSLWLLPFCPFALFALLPFCPYALMPFRPVALAPPLLSCSAKFGRLSNEGIFCSCFHISVHVQILLTLLMLLLSAQMTTKTFFSWRKTASTPFLAAYIEALSKHLKAWRWARSRCRSSCDLRI